MLTGTPLLPPPQMSLCRGQRQTLFLPFFIPHELRTQSKLAVHKVCTDRTQHTEQQKQFL